MKVTYGAHGGRFRYQRIVALMSTKDATSQEARFHRGDSYQQLLYDQYQQPIFPLPLHTWVYEVWNDEKDKRVKALANSPDRIVHNPFAVYQNKFATIPRSHIDARWVRKPAGYEFVAAYQPGALSHEGKDEAVAFHYRDHERENHCFLLLPYPEYVRPNSQRKHEVRLDLALAVGYAQPLSATGLGQPLGLPLTSWEQRLLLLDYYVIQLRSELRQQLQDTRAKSLILVGLLQSVLDLAGYAVANDWMIQLVGDDDFEPIEHWQHKSVRALYQGALRLMERAYQASEQGVPQGNWWQRFYQQEIKNWSSNLDQRAHNWSQLLKMEAPDMLEQLEDLADKVGAHQVWHKLHRLFVDLAENEEDQLQNRRNLMEYVTLRGQAGELVQTLQPHPDSTRLAYAKSRFKALLTLLENTPYKYWYICDGPPPTPHPQLRPDLATEAGRLRELAAIASDGDLLHMLGYQDVSQLTNVPTEAAQRLIHYAVRRQDLDVEVQGRLVTAEQAAWQLLFEATNRSLYPDALVDFAEEELVAAFGPYLNPPEGSLDLDEVLKSKEKFKAAFWFTKVPGFALSFALGAPPLVAKALAKGGQGTAQALGKAYQQMIRYTNQGGHRSVDALADALGEFVARADAADDPQALRRTLNEFSEEWSGKLAAMADAPGVQVFKAGLAGLGLFFTLQAMGKTARNPDAQTCEHVADVLGLLASLCGITEVALSTRAAVNLMEGASTAGKALKGLRAGLGTTTAVLDVAVGVAKLWTIDYKKMTDAEIGLLIADPCVSYVLLAMAVTGPAGALLAACIAMGYTVLKEWAPWKENAEKALEKLEKALPQAWKGEHSFKVAIGGKEEEIKVNIGPNDPDPVFKYPEWEAMVGALSRLTGNYDDIHPRLIPES